MATHVFACLRRAGFSLQWYRLHQGQDTRLHGVRKTIPCVHHFELIVWNSRLILLHASLIVLEVAAKGAQYSDDARFCADLHQHDKGRRYRQLAGLHDHIPGEDALRHFRHRVRAEATDATMAVLVDLFRTVGLIQGALLVTDGQLEPSHTCFKGCTYAWQGCQQVPVDEASRQELGRQLQSGANRLQLTCPFPEGVAKVRQATSKTGTPKDPTVVLLEIADVPKGPAAPEDRRQVAALLGLSQDEVPDLRLKWCHLRLSPQGELLGRCPKVPAQWLGSGSARQRPPATPEGPAGL